MTTPSTLGSQVSEIRAILTRQPPTAPLRTAASGGACAPRFGFHLDRGDDHPGIDPIPVPPHSLERRFDEGGGGGCSSDPDEGVRRERHGSADPFRPALSTLLDVRGSVQRGASSASSRTEKDSVNWLTPELPGSAGCSAAISRQRTVSTMSKAAVSRGPMPGKGVSDHRLVNRLSTVRTRRHSRPGSQLDEAGSARSHP